MTRLVRAVRQCWRYLRTPWLLEARPALDQCIQRHPAVRSKAQQRSVS